MSRLVIAILLLGSILTSCMQLDGDKNEARISNESGVAVEILWTAPGGDVHYANIEPGQVKGLFEWVGRCAPNVMVARTPDGKELARTQEPLCTGDLWKIGPPGAPSPS